MSSEEVQALQDEELEVLNSIYEGDAAFTSPASRNFQYKFGEDGASRSFVLDVTWGDLYPNEFPAISMDTFYNRHVVDSVKTRIVEKVKEEAEQYLGMSMTYSLFEYVKEHLEEMLEGQPDKLQEITERVKNVVVEEEEDSVKSKPKKEQLSKSQKRRMWDKGGIDSDERPRGWDWVDVIRHLSQTGGKDLES